MKTIFFLCPFLITLLASLVCTEDSVKRLSSLHRSSFPAGFVFGTASASYQFEGAANEDGKGPSIWDTFTHNYPQKIRDFSNGDIALDSYHRYKEDVAIMKSLGFDSYRFSISWPRLLPQISDSSIAFVRRSANQTARSLAGAVDFQSGLMNGGVNKKGIDYYNNLINELLLNGIQPYVTLFHWDVPQFLQDEYGGFLSIKIVDDFRDYVELCFRTFGDRVKHWITLNEPSSFADDGFATGINAPGRCSDWLASNCSGGDSSTEPYLVTHHQLLSHAAAVKLYRDKYQMPQKGQIGITLNCEWCLPISDSSEDSDAASRCNAFQYDWYMEPLKSGSYPVDMVTHVGKRLPQFSEEQSLMLKGSFDFIGINYYTTKYAADVPCKTENFTYNTDPCILRSYERDGIPIGPKTGSGWLYICPSGLLDLLLYTKYKFDNPVIYITENGVGDLDTGSMLLDDDIRVNYYIDHLLAVQEAIRHGVKVKGYFAWSLLDNFEWYDGYSVRFGVVYIDYKDGLKRYLKKSAKWFKEVLHSGNQRNTSSV